MSHIIACVLPIGAEVHVTPDPDTGTVGLNITFPPRNGIARPPITVEDDGRFHLGDVTLDTSAALDLAIALTGGGLKVAM